MQNTNNWVSYRKNATSAFNYDYYLFYVLIILAYTTVYLVK